MKFMLTKDPREVFTIINENFTALESEIVALENAGGRILGEDIVSPEDSPAFNRSTVDGYAVAARDSFGAAEGSPALFELVGEVLMGESAPSISSGECCQVHTGGMLPGGSDAVVMIEDCEVDASTVQCLRQVAPGENVIHRGEDIAAGSLAIEAGSLLRAPEIGLLASLGVVSVPLYRKPRICFFSSGNELTGYHKASLPAGKIRDSNAPALVYLASQMGAEAHYGGILEDSFDTFLESGRRAIEEVDLLVFSGGSSVGSRDYTAKVMDSLGSPGLLVEGISVQPGKPTLIANCSGKPVLGLPGHPVSALNIFALFGRAIIERLAGRKTRSYRAGINARLVRNIPSRSGRTDYVRVTIKEGPDGLEAWPVFGRSGMLSTLSRADGLAEIPSGKEGLRAGEEIAVDIWE